MLVCAHCGSQYIVYDREYVAGTGWVDRPRCGKCGREKFKEISKTSTDIEPVKLEGELSPLQLGESIVKKEDNNMAQCKEPGCERWAAVHGYCNAHFSKIYGISSRQYNAYKTKDKENPKDVAARIAAPMTSKTPEDREQEQLAPPEEPKEFVAIVLSEEIKEALERQARADCRSPAQQICWYIVQGLKRAEEKI